MSSKLQTIVVFMALALTGLCIGKPQNPFSKAQNENEISRYSVGFSPVRNRPYSPQPSAQHPPTVSNSVNIPRYQPLSSTSPTTTRSEPVYRSPITTVKPIITTTTERKDSTTPSRDAYGASSSPVGPGPKDYESYGSPQSLPIDAEPLSYVGHAPEPYAGYYYYYYPLEVSTPSTTTTTTTSTTTTTTKKPLVAFLTSPNVIGFGVIVLILVVFAPGIANRLNEGRALSSGEWLWLGREIEDKLDQLINISPPDFALGEICLQSLQCHWQTLNWIQIPELTDWQKEPSAISTCGNIVEQCLK